MSIDIIKATILTNTYKRYGKVQLLETYAKATTTEDESEIIKKILKERWQCTDEEIKNCNFIGIEKDDKYFEIAQKRINGITEISQKEEEPATTSPLPIKESPHNKAQRKDLWYIDPRLLSIEEGFNTRTDYGDIDELKDSIIENGVKIPLRGHKEGDVYIITDGHRRLMAINKAIAEGTEIARVPFMLEKKKTAEERIFEIILSNDGKPLAPLELGETYKKLVNLGYKYTEIAKKIGKTITHVSDMVKVAESPKEIKDLIKENRIAATTVAEVKNKLKNAEEADQTIKDKLKEKIEEADAIGKKEDEVRVTPKDFDDIVKKQPDNTKSVPHLDVDDAKVNKLDKKKVENVKMYAKMEVDAILEQHIEAIKEVIPEEFHTSLDDVELKY